MSDQGIERSLDEAESIALLQQECSAMGISVSQDSLHICVRHLGLVIDANKRMNLTRITDIHDALVLHILDSLLLSKYVDSAPEGPCLDMGTGAGFPGIPLIAATGRSFTMIDSVGKKVDFVNSCLQILDIQDSQAQHGRLEDLAREYRNQFSCVCARALASLPVLIEYATPFLAPDSLLVITKGNPDNNELSSGAVAARICGLSLIQHDCYELPYGLGHREVFVYRKIGASQVKLPRQAGMAKRRPLA